MTRLADYVFKQLVYKGIDHVFMLTGGGSMFLNDAIGRTEGLTYTCCHHEQACAMAAEGYTRVSNKIGVVNVTTGPGTINTLNGVFGAYTDSIPMLIISGQNKRETILPTYNLPGLRQLGEQEADIISMVKGITKYAVLINDPSTIKYHLDRAIHLATTGRPGPVWLDIPVDVSSTFIDTEKLTNYDALEDNKSIDYSEIDRICDQILSKIAKSERPSIMIGSGVRLAGALKELDEVIEALKIPVTTAWTAHDSIKSDNPYYCGRPGSIGDRAGNFTVQNSDVLLILGSRLNIRQVSYNWKDFARNAFKIQIDADPAELHKPTVKIELPFECELKLFLSTLLKRISTNKNLIIDHASWLKWCKERVTRYPVVTEKMKIPNGLINPYVFFEALFNKLTGDDITVCGNGSACVMPFQVGKIKKGMRLFCNSGSASMGYDIPAAIGASIAKKDNRIICLAGEGSAMFNIQELQTISHHNLPIKIIIINNGGYLSMRMTQMNFFKGNLVGEGPQSGVSFPDFKKVGEAFGIQSRILKNPNFSQELDQFLSLEGPALLEVFVDPDQLFEPKLTARQHADGKITSPSLEDMSPFLSKEELLENMLVPLAN